MSRDTQLITQSSPNPSTTVLSVNGDVDMSRSPELRASIQSALSPKPELLIIDLEHVQYMDSSGLATLVEAMRTASSNKSKLVLSAMHERVRAIFEIAKLDAFFTIVDTVDDAMSA